MPAFIDLAGRQFGNLLVLRRVSNTKQGHPRWWCSCACGTEALVSGCNLRTGNSTSCGCLQRQAARKNRLLRPYEAVYNVLVRNIAHSVHITYEDFVEFTKTKECHYCGASIRWGKESKEGLAYNLDRKDSSRGYRKNNLVVCCGRCNLSKNNHFTYDEWMQLAAVIRTWCK